MCTTCGCSGRLERHQPKFFAIDTPDQSARLVRMEHDILSANDALARKNREWLTNQNILALNFMSSPGAGKTSLLERTILDNRDRLELGVIEGDQETDRDAQRILATGCPAVQMNTGTGCHLDAKMLESALRRLEPARDSVVMIENIGNLVCPALFDLGEHFRIVISSVTEGDDKPLKYPHMFKSAHLAIINKVDLLPYVPFDLLQCIEFMKTINPRLKIIAVSVTRGDGLENWYDWLFESRKRRGQWSTC